jgi:hypothetical protein
MGSIAIRESVIEDIASLARCLRDEDAIEVVAQGYKDSAEALGSAFKGSKYRFTIVFKGKPVGMFGLCEVDSNTGNIWLLGAPDLSKMKKYFMRMSKEIVKEMLVEYPVLFAQVDKRYTKTHRWLTWLGADVGGDYKLNGVDFNNFVFRRV